MTNGEIWMVALTGLGVLIALASVVVMLVALNRIQQVQISPNQFEVKLVDQFVTRKDFANYEKRVDADLHELKEILRTEMPEMERRLAVAGEDRAVKLHDRINDILSEVSEVRGALRKIS